MKALSLLFLFSIFSLAVVECRQLPTVCVNGITRDEELHKMDVESWLDCPVNRSSIYDYIQPFDVNGDSVIDYDELSYWFSRLTTAMEKKILPNVDTILFRCDCNGDGSIDAWDWENSKYSCIKNCEAASLLWKYGGSRIHKAVELKFKFEADPSILK